MNDDINRSATDAGSRSRTDPALDIASLLTPMFEFGAAMMRMQERMVTALLRTTRDAVEPGAGDEHRTGAQDDLSVPEAEAEVDPAAELTDAVSIRAEQISRSNPDGDPVENWLQAEREVHAERQLSAAN